MNIKSNSHVVPHIYLLRFSSLFLIFSQNILVIIVSNMEILNFHDFSVSRTVPAVVKERINIVFKCFIFYIFTSYWYGLLSVFNLKRKLIHSLLESRSYFFQVLPKGPC